MRRVLGRGHARQAIEEFLRMLFANLGALESARGCMSINRGVEMAHMIQRSGRESWRTSAILKMR